MSLDWLLAPQLLAFQRAGYDVVGASAATRFVDHLGELGIRHVDIPAFTRSTNPLDDVRAFVQLVRVLRAERPDIVHTHNPKPGILGRIAARLTGVALIVNTQHGLWAQPDDPRRRRWPVYAVERLAASFGDVELVQNPEDVATLVETLRVPARKVRLLGNGVDLGRFDPALVAPGARARLRSEWGVDESTVIALVVGRLVREKGIVELLDAAQRLQDRGDVRVRFVIVGPLDADKADAVDVTTTGADGEETPASSGPVFTGERTDMPECYAAADLFVTASWREGFPRSAMEAAAMGLPTIATDIRGNRQVVDDGRTGMLVALRDPAALADAVAALAHDGPRRQAMGVAARQRAIDEFDQQRVIDRTLAAYAGVPDTVD